MTDIEITRAVEELSKIASTNEASNFGRAIIVADPKLFSFGWNLDNNPMFPSDKTIEVSNLDDAVKIVAKFSGDTLEVVEANLKSQSFDEGSQLFLHFTKGVQ